MKTFTIALDKNNTATFNLGFGKRESIKNILFCTVYLNNDILGNCHETEDEGQGIKFYNMGRILEKVIRNNISDQYRSTLRGEKSDLKYLKDDQKKLFKIAASKNFQAVKSNYLV